MRNLRKATLQIAANMLQAKQGRGRPNVPRQTLAQKASAVRAAQPQRKLPARTQSKAPVAIASTIRNVQPRVKGNMFGGGGMTITHREFCFDVNSESKYNPVRIPIQPGLPSLTRWLANIAPWFESYMFLGLEFEYVPSISTGRDGRLILGVDYDSNDSTPTDIHVLENLGDNASGSIWAPLTLRCTNANLHKMVKERYVRTTTPKANQDINTTDSGAFFLAIDGADAAHDGTKMGAIYVRYTVRLITPQVHSLSSGSTPLYSFSGQITGVTLTGGQVSNPLLNSFNVPKFNATSTSRWGDGSFINTNSAVPLETPQPDKAGLRLPAGVWDITTCVLCDYSTASSVAPACVLRAVTSSTDVAVTPVQNTDYANTTASNICFGRSTFVVTDAMQSVGTVFIPSYISGSPPQFGTASFFFNIHPHLADSASYGAAVTDQARELEHLRDMLSRLRAAPDDDKHHKLEEKKAGYFF